jgi:hypothetical protein
LGGVKSFGCVEVRALLGGGESFVWLEEVRALELCLVGGGESFVWLSGF